jgi:hypothetical protein
VCQQLCLSRKLTASVVTGAILTVSRVLIADLMVQVGTWKTGEMLLMRQQVGPS